MCNSNTKYKIRYDTMKKHFAYSSNETTTSVRLSAEYEITEGRENVKICIFKDFPTRFYACDFLIRSIRSDKIRNFRGLFLRCVICCV